MIRDILNKFELDKWLFHRAQILGHHCTSIKNNTGLNIAFIDTVTGEIFPIKYKNEN